MTEGSLTFHCKNPLHLKAYTCKIQVSLTYERQTRVFPLTMVDSDGPPLLSRNWLRQLTLNWQELFNVKRANKFGDVLGRHQKVFRTGLGTIRGFISDVKLPENATPVFCKARPVPYALREQN